MRFSVSLPFTRTQFFDVLAAYNASLWPFVIALWLLTMGTVVVLIRDRRAAARFLSLVLAIHWAWAGGMYHAAFFSRINPAAWLFGAIFLVQAGLFVWFGVLHTRLKYSPAHSVRQYVAWIFVGYSLLYPAIAWAEGHAYPRLPTFGVPCPTTILTIGLLLAADPPVPSVLTLIPIVWAFIGGSAAFLLGVRTDLMLLAGGIVLIASVANRTHFRRVLLWPA
jgi:hypothetical protein